MSIIGSWLELGEVGEVVLSTKRDYREVLLTPIPAFEASQIKSDLKPTDKVSVDSANFTLSAPFSRTS